MDEPFRHTRTVSKAHTHTQIHKHTNTHTLTCTQTQTQTHTNTQTQTHTHTHTQEGIPIWNFQKEEPFRQTNTLQNYSRSSLSIQS